MAVLAPGSGHLQGQSGSITPGQVAYMPTEGVASNRTQLTAEIAGACGILVAMIDSTGGDPRGATRVCRAAPATGGSAGNGHVGAIGNLDSA